jgi:hypothetical protein
MAKATISDTSEVTFLARTVDKLQVVRIDSESLPTESTPGRVHAHCFHRLIKCRVLHPSSPRTPVRIDRQLDGISIGAASRLVLIASAYKYGPKAAAFVTTSGVRSYAHRLAREAW